MENQDSTFNYWQDRWNVGNTHFHKNDPHPYLLEFEEHLPRSSRVLVPLCGKSVDLLYLANKGHEVHGCEFVLKAIEDFFKEQNLGYFKITMSSNNTVMYKATNKNITIYHGDFFQMRSYEIGKFGAIWDRGSLVAITPSSRNTYAHVVEDVMDVNCNYLLITLEIHGNGYHGPPFSIQPLEINKLFSTFCNVKHLVSNRISFDDPNVETCNCTYSLLTLKQ